MVLMLEMIWLELGEACGRSNYCENFGHNPDARLQVAIAVSKLINLEK
jgi:hypothetical protein